MCILSGAGLKAAWYGAEIFGDILAKGQGQADNAANSSSSSSASTSTAAAPTPAGVKPIAAVLDSIRADYAEVCQESQHSPSTICMCCNCPLLAGQQLLQIRFSESLSCSL